ncbi:MAG: hypothetical protein E6L04_10610 [Thaumarchaeota archaeon]|nr:MAG: hypothetical protein E6L04_10610 [Nitrososphaerota archaeon]TLX91555.1 MAG: hypothetical protein E6K97_02720 [Nitrososphaerota archaeon]
MVVDEKIEEARYLDKIKKVTGSKDFIPNLSAYMCATTSIPDNLLEDYNVKYGLKVSLDRPLNKDIFEEVARKRNNPNAIAFIKGYNNNFKKLKRDKTAKLLLTKRNIRVHRIDLPLQKNISASIIENVDKDSTISNCIVKWLFDDYEEADVIEVCKEFLRLMNDFVKNVTTKFP